MENIIKKVKDGLGGKIKNWEEKNPGRIYITIDKENIRETAHFIFEDCKARFIILTGIDTPLGYENLYHFDFDSIGTVVTVKTLIPKSAPEIESIATIIPGANFIEREVYDMLGIKFIGHPDPRRLLLSDDWPEGVHPLRRDFK
ncbi:hypothetical protein CO111_00985 [Candidatus Desantisbacteria bacterium CG_4_9_14_3_um_filter_50_7]|nr:MAG: hypothetical protein CO111_00985 [Candidatus Desantisbacteria bacterium CG_4_9_14_3_um_filter_50_7]